MAEVENNIYIAATLQQLITQAISSDPVVRYQAVIAVRRLSCSYLIDSLINSVILPTLVDSLRVKNNPSLQYEAAWALTNIASGTSPQTQAVVDAGAVPLLLDLLSSPHQNVCKQAVWALGNIIGDGPQLRDYVISLGVVAPLLNFIEPTIPITFLRNVTWVILNLCRWKDPPPPAETLRDILPALNILVLHTDTEVSKNALWSLSYVTDAGNDIIQMVVESGVVPKLVSLLSHQKRNVKKAAIRALGNIIATRNIEQIQAVLNCDALKVFTTLLTRHKKKICKKCLGALSNVAAANHTHIQAVIDANLIPLIIHHLDKGTFKNQKEAARAVSNMMVRGTEEQVAHLVNVGVIPPFCNLLNCEDIQVIEAILVGIYDILQKSTGEQRRIVNGQFVECGGFRQILLLQDDKRFPMAQTIAREIFISG